MPQSTYRWPVRVVAALLLMLFGFALAVWLARPWLSEEAVRQAVVTTIQREAPASFYVTGTIDLTTTVVSSETKYLFPELARTNQGLQALLPDGLLEFDFGTTRAQVRLPGRVSYGFDASTLRPEHIHVADDGAVEVRLPALSVYSVEPDLEGLEVETEVGWARTHIRSGRRLERQALREVQDAMRAQGAARLQDNVQARLHTAEALQKLLTPVLQAAGLQDPHFRFHVGNHLVVEPEE